MFRGRRGDGPPPPPPMVWSGMLLSLGWELWCFKTIRKSNEISVVLSLDVPAGAREAEAVVDVQYKNHCISIGNTMISAYSTRIGFLSTCFPHRIIVFRTGNQ